MKRRVIKSFDYLKSLPEVEERVTGAVARVIRSGRLILGPETEAFEEEYAAWVGAAHCVAVSSGTTALHLALMALGVGGGDEVITVANTCAPTVSAIRLSGATPVFVDVADDDLMMDVDRLEEHIGPRTRCILPVHLWGHAAAIDRILEIARRHDLAVVEDCAQAHGTRFDGRQVGTFGDLGCFSFYPTKNLGAYGDAGAIVTDRDDLARMLRARRMYGYDRRAISRVEGMNARVNEIQAAILRVKLEVLDDWLARRRSVARVYDREIANPAVRLPARTPRIEDSHHQYVVRSGTRSRLTAALDAAEVGWAIHYPVPVHRMPAYEFLGGASLDLPVTERAADEILSLPIHEGLGEEDARAVASILSSVAAEPE